MIPPFARALSSCTFSLMAVLAKEENCVQVIHLAPAKLPILRWGQSRGNPYPFYSYLYTP